MGIKNRASIAPEILLSELSECADIIDEKDKRIKELEALPKKILTDLSNHEGLSDYWQIDWDVVLKIFKENGVEL